MLEWGILATVVAVLYFTGLHTELLGKAQSLVVYSGIIQPDIEEESASSNIADYRLAYTDQQNVQHTLAEHQGKTIFLNFWATWCPPCIAEMPDINDLHKEVGDKVVFVMVSVDKSAAKTWEFVERKGFGFPVYHSRGGTPSVFASNSIPTTYVIAPDGTIKMKQVGMARYNTKNFKEFLLSL